MSSTLQGLSSASRCVELVVNAPVFAHVVTICCADQARDTQDRDCAALADRGVGDVALDEERLGRTGKAMPSGVGSTWIVRRSARPCPVSVAVELTEARIELETLVCRLSIQDGSVDWEAQVVTAHHVLDQTPFVYDKSASRSTRGCTVTYAAFRLTLPDGRTNRRLFEIARTARDRRQRRRAGGQSCCVSTSP